MGHYRSEMYFDERTDAEKKADRERDERIRKAKKKLRFLLGLKDSDELRDFIEEIS